MKKFLKITVILFGIFCVYLYIQNTKLSERAVAVGQVRSQTIKEINKKFGAVCGATDGGGVYGVESIGMSFKIPENMEINDARKIIVESAQIFLNNINSSTKLKKHMVKYPFEPKDIHLLFFTKNRNKEELGAFDLFLGNVSYDMRVLEKPHSFEVIHEESFEEALKIVETQKELKTL